MILLVLDTLLWPTWRPCWTHVGDSFGTQWKIFELLKRSWKEVRFQDEFEAIWEPRGKAKTSVSLQMGFSFQLYVIFSFSISFSSILEALWDPLGSEMAPKNSQMPAKCLNFFNAVAFLWRY